MATSSFSLVSALGSKDFAPKSVPLTDEQWRQVPPLIRRRILLTELMSQKPPKRPSNLESSIKFGEKLRNRAVLKVTENSEAKVKAEAEAEAQLQELELKKLREDLEVTDDIVNSEAKLHALYLKWLSYFDHHFDVEDEKAFKFRFGLFKDNARFINQWNKSGRSSTCGLNEFSDMTSGEFSSSSWKTYPKKANQVIPGIADI